MNWITAHPLSDLAIYWIFSAAVSSMPETTAASSPGYVWLYRFLHGVAGDVMGAVQSRLSTLLPNFPAPAPGTSSVTTVGIVSQQSTPASPNNGKQ